jgi:hypothetical protein
MKLVDLEGKNITKRCMHVYVGDELMHEAYELTVAIFEKKNKRELI